MAFGEMGQEVKKEHDQNQFLRYSIDSIVNSPPRLKNETIKFSVDNILKPTFGVKCDIVRKGITPIFQVSDKVRFGHRRSLDLPRPPSEEIKKRRQSAESSDTGSTASLPETSSSGSTEVWPAWVYCTRYSDRPSSGPRSRRTKKKEKTADEKRPRTAFSGDQLCRLKHEFNENRYLTEQRRQDLARELNLNEAQIKIWFQNKRAKMKKAKGEKNPLALQLMAQGLYNHSTIAAEEEQYLEEMAAKAKSC